jgi:hypothetical protein
MLLNKYSHIHAISKDNHAEELLFKIEQNIGIKKKLEDACFPNLLHMCTLLKQAQDSQLGFPLLKELNPCYTQLLQSASKLRSLAQTSDYIFTKLTEHLKKKGLNTDKSVREQFIACREIGHLVSCLTAELRGKADLIERDIP